MLRWRDLVAVTRLFPTKTAHHIVSSIMKITCPKCSKVLNIPDRLVGKLVKCPCGQQMRTRRPQGPNKSPDLQEQTFDPFASMDKNKKQNPVAANNDPVGSKKSNEHLGR